MSYDPAEIPVMILCGGQGTRIREASESLPKPMIDVGGKPILWHIMKIYHHYGHRHFVLCLGYKAWTIKEYFLNYREMTSDFTLEPDGQVTYHGHFGREEWDVTFAYTGRDSLTGRRVALASKYIEADRFMLTYGDGLADIDLSGLLKTHEENGLTGTVTGVTPTSRFGELGVEEGRVVDFAEKPELATGLINGGYFVFERAFFDYVSPESQMLESDPLQRLTRDRQLGMFQHRGFWRGMDTYREYVELNRLWDDGAPWRVWPDAG